MTEEYTFSPRFTYLSTTKSLIHLVCGNEHCDRSLVTRWFTTVTSILMIADNEFENLLQQYRNLQFKTNLNFSLTIVVNDEETSANVPIIVGTQLWFMYNEYEVNTLIDYDCFVRWKTNRLHPSILVYCPYCSFSDYIPLGCFFVGNKMYRLPILAAVDSRKFHVRKPGNYITVYFNGEMYAEDNHHEAFVAPLRTVKNELAAMRDEIYNLAFYTPSKLFARRIELALQRVRECKTKAQIAKTITCLSKDLAQGNVTSAISKNTTFACTDMGGQTNESHSVNDFNANVRKTDLENKFGYVRKCSRYICTPANNPLQVIFAPLHCVKIISSEVKTKSHQCLQTSSCAYVCKLNTTDNKNAGAHFEILPGVRFVIQRWFDSRKIRQFLQATCENDSSRCVRTTVFFPDATNGSFRIDDNVIAAITNDPQYRHLSFFHWKRERVCVIYDNDLDIVDERFGFTPLTRECLLREYKWYEKLSPELNGNVALLGTLASQWLLLHHNATAKVVAGMNGSRHAYGLAISCRVPKAVHEWRKFVAYTHNDLINYNAAAAATATTGPIQNAIVLVTAFHAYGVEDGIIVNKSSCERGLGMIQNDTITAQIYITHQANDFQIAVPTPNSEFLEVIYSLQHHGTPLQPKTIILPESLRHVSVKQGTFLCDILGAVSIGSYSIFLKCVGHQSASRILFDNYYDVGEIANRTLLFDSVTILPCTHREKNDLQLTLNFREFRSLELGDKISTITGQKATVTRIESAENLPFFGCNERLPPMADVIINISSCKRQTLGLNYGGLCRMAKVADPDSIDLSEFRGDDSIRHSRSLQDVLRFCHEIGVKGNVPVFDGITGRYCGKGDLYIVPVFRYEQDASKSVFYTHWNEDYRTPNGDFEEKGRGRKGGMKWSQTQTSCMLAHGAPSSFLRHLQASGEPRTRFSHDSGVVSQSFISPQKSCNIHGYHLRPVRRENDSK